MKTFETVIVQLWYMYNVWFKYIPILLFNGTIFFWRRLEITSLVELAQVCGQAFQQQYQTQKNPKTEPLTVMYKQIS